MALDWPWTLDTIGDITNAWTKPARDAGPLAIWALWAVESLDYLALLDVEQMGNPKREAFGHSFDVIEIAHARWAAGSAITAIDLCAAALAICHAGRSVDDNAASLHQLSRAGSLRAALPPAAISWVDATWRDSEYQTVRRARNPLTHHRLKRLVTGTTGAQPPPGRTSFPVGPADAWVPSVELVAMARQVGEACVGAYFEGIAASEF